MIQSFGDFQKKVLGQKLWKMEGDRLYFLERSISSRISWFLFKWFPSVRGNHVTFFSFVLLFVVSAISILILQGYITSYLYSLAGLLFLYLITITDKVDGELARAHDGCTQKGLFYDRTVHFLYPFIFYLLVGSFFFSVKESFVMLIITFFAASITQLLNLQIEWRLLIREKIKNDKFLFTDFLERPKPKRGRPFFVFRVIDYLTFMVYAWVLFFYTFTVFVSVININWAYFLYIFQITLTIVVSTYKVFIDYPNNRLFTKSEVEKIYSE